MNKRDSSKKAEAGKRVPLAKMLAGQTFLTLMSEKHAVQEMTVEAFDAWAASLVEDITGVDRAVWDVFARQRLLNHLIAENILAMHEENGTIVLEETEVFSSAAQEKTSETDNDEPAVQAG